MRRPVWQKATSGTHRGTTLHRPLASQLPCRCAASGPVLRERLEVYDVTGSPRVPTLAFRLDGVTVAYASGFSFGDALRDGLAEVLLFYQAQGDGEAPYAPAPVPPIPEHGCVPGMVHRRRWRCGPARSPRVERRGRAP